MAGLEPRPCRPQGGECRRLGAAQIQRQELWPLGSVVAAGCSGEGSPVGTSSRRAVQDTGQGSWQEAGISPGLHQDGRQGPLEAAPGCAEPETTEAPCNAGIAHMGGPRGRCLTADSGGVSEAPVNWRSTWSPCGSDSRGRTPGMVLSQEALHSSRLQLQLIGHTVPVVRALSWRENRRTAGPSSYTGSSLF